MAEVVDKLAIKGEDNAGSSVTQLVKWCVNAHRVRGVHVTPTVFLNSTQAPQVGSGWAKDEWLSFVDSVLA